MLLPRKDLRICLSPFQTLRTYWFSDHGLIHGEKSILQVDISKHLKQTELTLSPEEHPWFHPAFLRDRCPAFQNVVHHYYLGACWKTRLLGLLNLNLHFNEVPGWIKCMFKFAKHCSSGQKTSNTWSGSASRGPESIWQTKRWDLNSISRVN